MALSSSFVCSSHAATVAAAYSTAMLPFCSLRSPNANVMLICITCIYKAAKLCI